MNTDKTKSNDKRKDPITDSTPLDKIKIPLPTKILAILCIVQCIITAPVAYTYILDFINTFINGDFSSRSISSFVIYIVFLISTVILIALLIAIGINLLLNKRRTAAICSNAAAIATASVTVCSIMLAGVTPAIYILTLAIILLVVLKSHIDPSLSEERKLQSKLRDLETKNKAEKGQLGFEEKEGLVKVNYFNMFWLFFISCIIGYIFEIIWHMTVDDPGVYQERAGLLFGPFSPIYGFGAVLITLLLRKLQNKNFILVFVVSALIGGFFEYFASLFLEASFGVRSWDYSHLPFNISGRTSLRFFIVWGLIGVVWVKLLLTKMIKLINKVPWKLRYSITLIASIFMIINVVMTFQALDCWYARSANHEPQTPIEQFYAQNFDDDYMHARFENMKMETNTAVRESN